MCLTLGRIALTPVLLYLLIHNDLSQAFVVFIIIILTDIFDGMTARMLGACTRFGAIMDTPTVGLGLVKSPIGIEIAIAIDVIGVIAALIYAIKYFTQKKKANKSTLQEGISND